MQFINAETEEEFLQEMGETKEHVLIRLKEKFKLSDPETNCQGLFNQIHKKSTKKVPEALYGS